MNELIGKKVWFLGDSITEGVGTSKPENIYLNVFARLSGAIVKNYGISGTRIAPQEEIIDGNVDWNNDFVKRSLEMEDGADYIVIFGGTNDFGHGTRPLGKVGDTTSDTFCGAYYKMLENLYTKYPYARIIVMTPTHRREENITYSKHNLRRNVFVDYINAIRGVSELLAVPVLDLYANSGLTPSVEAIKNLYMPDELHPSDLGHKRIAEELYHFIKERFI